MSGATRCLRLARYAPEGVPEPSCFELSTEAVRQPGEGEVLVEVHWLSMDPFPRLCMRGEASMAPQLPLGAVMMGRGAGRVLRSNHVGFAPGDLVAGEMGWRELACVKAEALRSVDASLGHLEASLGLLGPSGLTAYFTIQHHAQPKAGETVVVSAAAGSVGSTACRLAALAGARVVGIGAGPRQSQYLLDEVGVAAAVDGLDAERLGGAIAAACPRGVDVFLDGVGGVVHDAVMGSLNVGARVVVYGLVSSYGEGAGNADLGPRHLMQIIMKRARITGFLVGDHGAEFAQALKQLAAWLADGKLVASQTVHDGLEAAPHAFAALFGDARPGKQLVRLAAANRNDST